MSDSLCLDLLRGGIGLVYKFYYVDFRNSFFQNNQKNFKPRFFFLGRASRKVGFLKSMFKVLCFKGLQQTIRILPITF